VLVGLVVVPGSWVVESVGVVVVVGEVESVPVVGLVVSVGVVLPAVPVASVGEVLEPVPSVMSLFAFRQRGACKPLCRLGSCRTCGSAAASCINSTTPCSGLLCRSCSAALSAALGLPALWNAELAVGAVVVPNSCIRTLLEIGILKHLRIARGQLH